MKDPRDPLSNTLQTWRHEPSTDADFKDHVWARILAETQTASASTSARASIRTTRLHFLGALPLAASLAILFAVAAGTTTAFALNNARTSERMAATYARSIDPVLMTNASSAAHSHVDTQAAPSSGSQTSAQSAGHSVP